MRLDWKPHGISRLAVSFERTITIVADRPHLENGAPVRHNSM